MPHRHRSVGEPPHEVLAAESFGVPGADPALHVESPHDVLAAEEFGMPGADPALHVESPHDVLAAEEFGMPAPDSSIHPDPVVLPEDPTGLPQPHDILVAEAFPLPWARPGVARCSGAGWGPRVRLVLGAAALFAVLHALRRRVPNV